MAPNWWSRWVNRLRASHSDPTQVLSDFNRALLLIVEPESLHAGIVTRMREIHPCSRAAIFQHPDHSTALRPTYWTGFDDLGEGFHRMEISSRGRLTRWLRVNEKCLLIDEASGVVSFLRESERDLLRRLDIRICVPLISLNRLTGFVLLGTSGLGPPDQQRLDLLLLLAGQAALALENAALYAQQRDRLARLHRAERLATAGKLAAGVAHEIRNPLTSIRSTIQYLQGRLEEDQMKKEMIGGLLEEIDRIDQTVSDLLDLSKPREFDPQEMDVIGLLDQVATLVTVQANKRGVKIERRLAGQPLLLLGDENKLKEVFLNLGLNALQAMEKGGLLRIEAREIRSNGGLHRGWAEIRILDTGEGIPSEDLNVVFDPFYTTKSGGTGLGLAICHSIVQLHEGEIEFQELSGWGACAVVRLPVRHESTEE